MVKSTDLARAIRAELKGRGWSYQNLADASQINRVTLGRRLSGAIPITWDQLWRIADALGTSPHELVDAAENVRAAS